MIYYKKRFKKKFNDFVSYVASDKLHIFTIGFYQLLDKEIVDDNIFLDKKELLDILNSPTFIKDRVSKVQATEEIAFFLITIAHIYGSILMFEKALFFYQIVLHMREEYLGEKSLEIAENYQSIAGMYEQMEDFDKALGYYKKSLAIRKELSYVENNLLVAESYNRLALVYYHLEYYNIALGYIKDSIRIRERLLPSDHLLLENSYHNYKYIKKETEPKEDYIYLVFKTLIKLKAMLISRLVTFK
jgi:tetratricopeptide (TPR) repeat protein